MTVNDVVYVRLTNAGRVAEEIWHNRLHLDPLKHTPPAEDGWRKFQLWELMNIFGPEMVIGNPKQPLFESNEIRLAGAAGTAPTPPREWYLVPLTKGKVKALKTRQAAEEFAVLSSEVSEVKVIHVVEVAEARASAPPETSQEEK